MSLLPGERTRSAFGAAMIGLIAGLGGVACAADVETDDGAADPVAGSGQAERSAADSSAVYDGGEPDPGRAPFRNFALPPDPAQGAARSRHAVHIENSGPVTVVVRASAGAAPVVLDTLSSGDAYRVDLDAPEGALRIEWISLDGTVRGSTAVPSSSGTTTDTVMVVHVGAEVWPE
jgi:hypothetical protein